MDQFRWLDLVLPPQLCYGAKKHAACPPLSDQASSSTRPRCARKRARKAGASSRKPKRVIEYIKVPKHWFSDPLNHKFKTAVRPPTKGTRRKELSIDLRMPLEIFVDLMKPMATNDMENFEWEDEEKTTLVPTRKGKSFLEYKYMIQKPEMVSKYWSLEQKEPTIRVRKEGKLVQRRRGLGSARLHLSQAAEERGERTDLLAQITGNVSIYFKVPNNERAMPTGEIKFKVSTLVKSGHIEWATTFAPRTAAALRKQMQTHLRSMIESPEYPTLSTSNEQGLLTSQSETVRPEPPPRGRLALPAPMEKA